MRSALTATTALVLRLPKWLGRNEDEPRRQRGRQGTVPIRLCDWLLTNPLGCIRYARGVPPYGVLRAGMLITLKCARCALAIIRCAQAPLSPISQEMECAHALLCSCARSIATLFRHTLVAHTAPWCRSACDRASRRGRVCSSRNRGGVLREWACVLVWLSGASSNELLIRLALTVDPPYLACHRSPLSL